MRLFYIIILFTITLNLAALEQAKLHYSEKKAPYCEALEPSTRWHRYLDKMKNFISDCQDINTAILFSQTQCGFDHRSPYNEDIVNAERAALFKSFPHFSPFIEEITDSPIANAASVFQSHDKFFSNIIFFNYNNLYECLTYVRPNVVCEIGGGYGSPGFSWLTNTIHRPSIFIDIDYPECLFFAEIYLKNSVKNCKLIYVTSNQKIQEFSSNDPVIILCPIQYADSLLSLPIDLVINIGSMQEMDESALDYWMNWLNTSSANYFYTCNYFANKIEHLRESSNVYTQRMGPEWRGISTKHSTDIPIAPFNCQESFATILTQRNLPIDEEALIVQYWRETSKNKLSLKSFLMGMECYRVTQNTDVAFNLLQKSYEGELDFIPKEALYLCRKLLNTPNNRFTKKHLEELSNISNDLEKKYKLSIKGQ